MRCLRPAYRTPDPSVILIDVDRPLDEQIYETLRRKSALSGAILAPRLASSARAADLASTLLQWLASSSCSEER